MNEITVYQLFDLMELGEETQIQKMEAVVVSKKGKKYQAKAYWKDQVLIFKLEIG